MMVVGRCWVNNLDQQEPDWRAKPEYGKVPRYLLERKMQLAVQYAQQQVIPLHPDDVSPTHNTGSQAGREPSNWHASDGRG